MAQLPAQLVDERVVNHDRVKSVRSVKHPIGIRRQTQNRKMLFVIEFIEEFHREARLRKVHRTRSTNMETSACRKAGLVFKRGLPLDRFIERQMSKRRTRRGGRV